MRADLPCEAGNRLPCKVLFIVGPALGHVTRSLVIARKLAEVQAIEIVFAGPSRGYGERIVKPQFPFVGLRFDRPGEPGFANHLEKVIEDTGPDLICLDINPALWLYELRFPTVPVVFITNWFLTGLGSKTTAQDELFRRRQTQWNQLRGKKGLAPIMDARDLYHGDLVLCCDPLGFRPDTLNDDHHIQFTGPCSWFLQGELPDDLQNVDSMVFVSFGSTGESPFPVELAEAIARDTGSDTVVWLGRHPDLAKASGKISHLSYERLPVTGVLAKSRFCITHGGTGSTYAAMLAGCPVGIWPGHRNHVLMSEILVEYGLTQDLATGMTSPGPMVDPDRIRDRIEGFLHPNDHLGPQTAAGLIQDLIPGLSNPRSPGLPSGLQDT